MTSAKILIVDDEPQIRRVLRTTLTSQGYTVAEAKSGDEALEMIRDERPDLILLDVNMPGRSGLETCREIRATSDVPIIMLTVRNSERDKVQALDAGADDYVVKPFGVRGADGPHPSGVAPVGARGIAAAFPLGRSENRLRETLGDASRESPSASRRRNSICCASSSPIRARPSATGACCKPCGDPTTERKPNTCACSSTSFARKSSRIPTIRATSTPSHGSAIASSARRNAPAPAAAKNTPKKRTISPSLRDAAV